MASLTLLGIVVVFQPPTTPFNGLLERVYGLRIWFSICDCKNQVRSLKEAILVQLIIDQRLQDLLVQVGTNVCTAGWLKLNLCVDLVSFEVVAVVIAVDEAQVSAFAVWNEASCDAGHALDQLSHGLHSRSNHVALVVVDCSAHGTAVVYSRLSQCQLTGIMGGRTAVEDGLIQGHLD